MSYERHRCPDCKGLGTDYNYPEADNKCISCYGDGYVLEPSYIPNSGVLHAHYEHYMQSFEDILAPPVFVQPEEFLKSPNAHRLPRATPILDQMMEARRQLAQQGVIQQRARAYGKNTEARLAGLGTAMPHTVMGMQVVETTHLPDDKVYITGEDKVFMHPTVHSKLMEELTAKVYVRD